MHTRSTLFVIVAAILLALAPWALALFLNHGPLHVPPEFTDDTGFYYAQLHAIAIGHPFFGNPYFKEHANEMAGTFFGADWIAAAPLLVGVPLVPAMMLDLVVSFAAIACLLLLLCRLLGMRRWWYLVSLAAVLSVSYWMIVRPVSMQVVIPCFLFFLLAYFAWLKDPDSWYTRASLVASSALTLYVYTFLWQIAIITLGVSFLYSLLWERRLLPALLLTGGITCALALPVAWYTYVQIHQTWYWQMIARTGYVATRTIGSSAIIALVLTAFVFAAFWLLDRHRPIDRHVRVFFGITGIALLIAAFSNVVTDKDLELAIHIIRFTYVWAAIAGSYACFLFFGSDRNAFRRDALSLRGLCILVYACMFAHAAFQTLETFKTIATPTLIATQAYDTPAQWLNAHTEPGSVVFADDDLSYIIPMLTHDYVLFQPDGGLYLMSDAELQDRYLTSRMFDALSLSDIEKDVRVYAGAGNAFDAPMTEDRTAKLCLVFHLTGCGSMTDAVSYLGLPYFESMYARYENIVLEDPATALAQFDVSYIVKDTQVDTTMHPEKLPGTALVATVGRFQIFSFTPTDLEVKARPFSF